MKKLSFLLLAVLCLTVTACDNDEPRVAYLHVKVEDASRFGNVVTVKLMGVDRTNNHWLAEVARGDWKGNGFTMVLPRNINPNYLYTLIGNYGLIAHTPSTMIVSNRNVKVGDFQFWGIDSDGNRVVRFYPYKIDENGNAKSVVFTYANSAVTISGYAERGTTFTGICEERENVTITYVGIRHTIYSINWERGWNVWIFSSVFRPDPERTVTEEWTSTSIDRLIWRGY